MSSASNKASCSRSSSGRSKNSARLVAQTTEDARLNAEFEQSERPFDCSSSSGGAAAGNRSGGSAPSSAACPLISRGCSGETSSSHLGAMLPRCSIWPSRRSQHRAARGPLDRHRCAHPFPVSERRRVAEGRRFGEVNLLNPILVHCKNSGKPFYAILHRNDVGLIIDLEPVNPSDVPVTAAGALKSYKLAAKAISRLQSLPSRNISLLCDVLVREVRELTGYDRVMAYKFHEDEHGEVISECRRSDLEPYLGLHYPATDIPQASRFLFLKNKVRMICDCSAQPIRIIQDKRLAQPLSLCGSTLRAPHGCHAQYMANMGSIASLVMSVTINDDDIDHGGEQPQKARKLWGLVVCHHTSPRFVPFPLRYACEFLMQVFAVQLNKETVLCDMLLRDAPVGIFTQSPNVMDLVKCDGAALYYRNQFWLLGVTPAEAQIKDISGWLIDSHNNTTGLSTDSLSEAGYPGASSLGVAVCGMAAIKITSRDFIFWFRSHVANDIKWGGAKNDPIAKGDEGRKMYPRSSFEAFLEVVKRRSLPWEDIEMDAIHSLQLILRSSLKDELENDSSKAIVNFISEDAKRIQGVDELRTVANEMVRLIETATVPIMAVDTMGNVNGWNVKAAELTGLPVEKAIGTPLVDLVEDESVEVVNNMLSLALQDKEEHDVEMKLKSFSSEENAAPIILLVNACCSHDGRGNVVGVCFVAHDITGEKLILDKYTRIQGDYIAINSNPNTLIPPIFIINEFGCCIEWNAPMQKLTGLKREDAVDKILAGEVFSVQNFGCRVKDCDMLTRLRIVLNGLIAGHDSEKLHFGFFNTNGRYVEAILSATKRTNSEGGSELQHALQLQRMSQEAEAKYLKGLAYVRREVRNPLQGLTFTRSLMEASDLTAEQKRLLRTATLCQEQLAKIVDDMDLESIEECYMEMSNGEFNLGESLEAVMSQGMAMSKEKEVALVLEAPVEASRLRLYGDNPRLQQALADFLLNALRFTSPCEGPVMLRVTPRIERIGTSMQIAHLEFRIAHPAPGIPDALIQEMFHHKKEISREGLGLYISQKLVKIMSGTVQYLREATSSSLIVHLELPAVNLGEP
ncbi:unnamed protein product [Spirodela intermedia]|uniref:Uncharacterized protein n=1 Tax=Spirodela intermedia TaxID=51605 RepID=A0A7I8IHG0_SPIIN|nr:unnamed protein product [Spirodela intermedia]CAA6657315.1 unnamed protein product [Spirodela intermedia]